MRITLQNSNNKLHFDAERHTGCYHVRKQHKMLADLNFAWLLDVIKFQLYPPPCLGHRGHVHGVKPSKVCSFHPTHVQYTQTESNCLKAKTIRVSLRFKDFRLTGSRLAKKMRREVKNFDKSTRFESIRIPESRFNSTEIRS